MPAKPVAMIDWDRISELREEVGEDDLSEVLALFCEEVEDVLANLPGDDIGSLKANLHFLKGSALNIGLKGVSDLCRVEERKLQDDPASVPAIEPIRSAYRNARSKLGDLL